MVMETVHITLKKASNGNIILQPSPINRLRFEDFACFSERQN